ncbi:hypothetical protein Emin_0592 [Elusimicrobium minutum Pei191]|uniref:Uncharacterized protein n=1 Tax=Elusimicrobium minutum (strain Pei191) TaxID=445932 RepID=B2KC20_ELUMP|nr:hypothetical protein [Elusimicrobium minutum]ACC98147.1 hypothetical protein Emin_0592 [Elusimicrobium minutum Pei191]
MSEEKVKNIFNYKRHLTVLLIIFIAVTAFVFLLNTAAKKMPYPYDEREIPSQVKQWK